MIFYKVLQSLEWFEIKNKCVLWEVHNIVRDDNLFISLSPKTLTLFSLLYPRDFSKSLQNNFNAKKYYLLLVLEKVGFSFR